MSISQDQISTLTRHRSARARAFRTVRWASLAGVVAFACGGGGCGRKISSPSESADRGHWELLAGGFNTGSLGEVRTLASYGQSLVVGGTFGWNDPGLGLWNGSSWLKIDGLAWADSVPPPTFEWGVRAAVVQDGDLIVGGWFTHAGGSPAPCIARYDGSRWHPMGDGFPLSTGHVPSVNALVIYKGEVVAGGWDLLGSSDIVRWDGASWHPIGEVAAPGEVNALAVLGGDLIVGGRFQSAGGIAARWIARWDGASWHPLGSGPGSGNGGVEALQVVGSELIVGGTLAWDGGRPVSGAARWNGATWTSMAGAQWVSSLTVYNGDIVAAGSFSDPGGSIARWDGAGWRLLGHGPDGSILALVTYNGLLIAGGAWNNHETWPIYHVGCWRE